MTCIYGSEVNWRRSLADWRRSRRRSLVKLRTLSTSSQPSHNITLQHTTLHSITWHNIITAVAVFLGVTFFIIAFILGYFWLDAVIFLVVGLVVVFVVGVVVALVVVVVVTAQSLVERRHLPYRYHRCQRARGTAGYCYGQSRLGTDIFRIDVFPLRQNQAFSASI